MDPLTAVVSIVVIAAIVVFYTILVGEKVVSFHSFQGGEHVQFDGESFTAENVGEEMFAKFRKTVFDAFASTKRVIYSNGFFGGTVLEVTLFRLPVARQIELIKVFRQAKRVRREREAEVVARRVRTFANLA